MKTVTPTVTCSFTAEYFCSISTSILQTTVSTEPIKVKVGFPPSSHTTMYDPSGSDWTSNGTFTPKNLCGRSSTEVGQTPANTSSALLQNHFWLSVLLRMSPWPTRDSRTDWVGLVFLGGEGLGKGGRVFLKAWCYFWDLSLRKATQPWPGGCDKSWAEAKNRSVFLTVLPLQGKLQHRLHSAPADLPSPAQPGSKAWSRNTQEHRAPACTSSSCRHKPLHWNSPWYL